MPLLSRYRTWSRLNSTARRRQTVARPPLSEPTRRLSPRRARDRNPRAAVLGATARNAKKPGPVHRSWPICQRSILPHLTRMRPRPIRPAPRGAVAEAYAPDMPQVAAPNLARRGRCSRRRATPSGRPEKWACTDTSRDAGGAAVANNARSSRFGEVARLKRSAQRRSPPPESSCDLWYFAIIFERRLVSDFCGHFYAQNALADRVYCGHVGAT
jgi:hypothetical protein